jgi:hypothetical protein
MPIELLTIEVMNEKCFNSLLIVIVDWVPSNAQSAGVFLFVFEFSFLPLNFG